MINRPDEGLIVQIPDGDVTITATAETDFRVGADRKSVASRGTRCQFCFDTWRRLHTCTVPQYENKCKKCPIQTHSTEANSGYASTCCLKVPELLLFGLKSGNSPRNPCQHVKTVCVKRAMMMIMCNSQDWCQINKDMATMYFFAFRRLMTSHSFTYTAIPTGFLRVETESRKLTYCHYIHRLKCSSN